MTKGNYDSRGAFLGRNTCSQDSHAAKSKLSVHFQILDQFLIGMMFSFEYKYSAKHSEFAKGAIYDLTDLDIDLLLKASPKKLN